MLWELFIYLLAFTMIWIGAGMAINSVERLASFLKLSTFAVSFLVLGLFTSIGEFSVGINAIAQNDPEIFVGNLIGASIVIFLMIVPLLAITGNKLKINPEFRNHNLLLALFTIATPTLLVLDGAVSLLDALVAISMYLFLVVSVQRKRGFFESLSHYKKISKKELFRHLGKIAIAVTIVFVGSRLVVTQTLYFSNLLQVSPFVMSLLIISIGTNIPELSFVVRSAFLKSNQVAFGNYVGSASFNAFLFGFLTCLQGGQITLNNSYIISLLCLLFGLATFYTFARSGNVITRKEGVVLLMFYLTFLLSELLISKFLA